MGAEKSYFPLTLTLSPIGGEGIRMNPLDDKLGQENI